MSTCPIFLFLNYSATVEGYKAGWSTGLILTFMALLVTSTLEAEWLHVHAHAKSMARLKEEQKSPSVC